MPGPINKVSVILNGGIDEQGASELSAPVAAQGSSLTLRRSVNTRLSPLRGTCERAPSCTSVKTYSDDVHAVIPCEAGQNSLVVFRHTANRMLGPDGSGDSVRGEGGLLSQTTGLFSTPAASFLPSRIDAAGGAPGEPGATEIMTCYDSSTGYLYHAYSLLEFEVDFYIVVYVTGVDGSIIATPRRFSMDPVHPTETAYLAMTAHGAHGVRIWAIQEAEQLSMYDVEYTGNNGISFNVTPVFVPFVGATFPFCFSVCSGEIIGADGSADSTYAQFAYFTSTALSDGQVSRVDVNTGAATAVTISGADGTAGAICVSPTSAGIRVGAAFQDGTLLTACILDPTLTLLQTGTATHSGGTLVAQFVVNPAEATSSLIVLQQSSINDGIDAAEVVRVYSQGVSSNTLTEEKILPWMRIKSCAAQVAFSATERFPLFELVRYYGPDDSSLLDTDYVPDPDVQVWMFRSPTNRAPVVRFGTVRGAAAPARMRTSSLGNFTSLTNFGTGLWSDYFKDLPGASGTTPRTSRWVSFSFPKVQPNLAYDRDGVTMAAASVAFEWDGVLPMEMGGPLYMPHFALLEENDGGDVWDAGDYILATHYEWTDAVGRTHRSAVTARAYTSTGFAPNVFVTAPTASFRDGLYDAPVTCVVYASTVNDPTPRRVDSFGSRGSVGWRFENLTAAEEGDPVIYSTGGAAEEQMPQPPSPLFDITIIGDRAWGIDSEYRSRIIYSKRRVAGVGYEWHPGYEILLPSGSGPAMAIGEWQGGVLVIAKYGIFGVSGDGPDNLVGNPSGGGFSKPQRLSDVGTTNYLSVVATPNGVVFQRDEDLMLFAGSAPTVLAGPRCAEECRTTLVLRDQDEVVFFFPSGQKVWNYALNRWTTWSLLDVGTSATGDFHVAVALPYDRTKALLVSTQDAPRAHLLDSNTAGTLPMVWETDWLLLGGDFQDHCNVQHVVFSARRLASHGVQIDVFTGYDETTPSTTKTWADAGSNNLAAIAASSGGRYTLKVQPTNRGTRAIKVRVTEVSPTGQGMRPISLTLYHNVEANLMETDIKPGAFK